MNCKTRKGRLLRHIGAVGLLAALAFSAACSASPASVDGPTRGESDDCFGGALSSDPIHCEVLEWAHNGEVIDVDAVYRAGRALYIYLTRTSGLDDAARQKMLTRSREVARMTGEYECVLKPRLCGSGVLSGPDGGYILPRSSVYQTIEVFPGGAEARRSSPGWQVFEQLWPEVAGVVGGASGGDDDFDISGVDRTNLPALKGNCDSLVIDDADLNEICIIWDGYPGLSISNSYDDLFNDKAYVYVRAGVGEEAAKIAAAKTTLTNSEPDYYTEDRLVVVAVPHDFEELWRWSLVLERFANSSGNTLGITDARLGFNELGGLGKDRRYVFPLKDAPDLTDHVLEREGFPDGLLWRLIIQVETLEFEKTVAGLPRLLRQLEIPESAVGLIYEKEHILAERGYPEPGLSKVPLEVGPAPAPDVSFLEFDRFDALYHYAPDDTLEERYEDVRLVLSYDSTANAFRGTLTNREGEPLLKAKIELRLDGSADRSTAITLVDVASMQVVEIALHVDGEPFTYWQVLMDVDILFRIPNHP